MHINLDGIKSIGSNN